MSSEILNDIISITANCIVFAYFLFAPFRTRFRYDYFKTALLAGLLTTITVTVSILFFIYGKFLSSYWIFGILLWLFCALILFHIAIKGSSFEILFIILVILNLYVNVATASKVIMNAMDFNVSDSVVYALLRILILIACIPLIWVLLGKLYRQVIEFNMNFSFWKIIWAIPALFYLIFFIKIIPDYWRMKIDVGGEDVIFAFLWAFTTYAVFCVTLVMLVENYKGIMAAQQTQLIASQYKMQESQYAKLLENIENTSRLRHDWRHHLLSINSFVENGRMEDLKNYLEVLNPSYMNAGEVSLCQNHIVDIILQHYAAIARENGISISISANVPNTLLIAATDLCIIFGNLVENAVEACVRQESELKLIEIKAEMKAMQLALLIRNTYQGELIYRDHCYYSSKREGVGIGLSSVDKVVKKNRGTMKIERNEKTFKVNVLFHVK